MGLFEKIFGAKQPQAVVGPGYFQTLTAYQPVFRTWNGSLYESLLVRSAIDARARHISKLKLEITGSAQPKLQTQLKYAPNDWQTWSQFLYRLSTFLDMNTTAFIVPVYDKFVQCRGFYPVLPSSCEIIEDSSKNTYLRYTFRSGKKAVLPIEEVGILTKMQYESDFFGAGNGPLNSTVQLMDLQDQGIAEAIKNGATYRFMAKMANFTKAEDLARERKRFTKENLQEGGGILLFPNNYQDIQQLKQTAYTVDPAQIELINQNVFSFFGVNMDILQNKAIGDAWSAFYEGAIEPFAIQFSEVLTRVAFTQNEIAHGSLFMLTANRLQYMSTTDKLNVSAQMADRGIMSVNEIRDIWNLAPVENGDQRTIRGEYYTINSDGTYTHHDDDVASEAKENSNE